MLLGCLAPSHSSAHLRGRSYCTVSTVAGGIDVSVQVPVQHLVEPLGLAPDKLDDAAVLTVAPRLLQQLEEQVRATTPAGPCEVVSTGPRFEGQRERQAVVDLRFGCPPGPVTLSNRFRLNVDPYTETVCVIDGEAWVFSAGALERTVGTPPRLPELLLDFLKLGAQHVFAGIDHVLFVLSLLLGAASAAGGELGRGLRRVAWLITGFTLGHSVTLMVAALGLVEPDPRLTESLIALSIVVVAVHNILRENPGGRTLTSSAFGLVHGFGFASVLADIGLPARGAVPALLSFNVGIELAQLAIVGLFFPGLVWAGRRSWFRSRLLLPVSGLIAALALIWFVKRSFGLSGLAWLGE